MKLQMLALTMVFLAACGGSDTEKADAKPQAEKQAAAAEKPAPEPPPAPEPEPEKKVEIVVDDGTVVTVNLEANDAMQFNTAEIKVAAGRTVKLNLKHVGKMPLEMMGHNFVLLAEGTDVAAFTAAGVTAKDTDYIAAADAGKVIAKTKLLGGGQADAIEFSAPAPGTYDFLCTFPGHSAIMKGKLIVT